MSVWQDLLSASITVEAFLLEDLLETLAKAPFPINPEIEHHTDLLRDGRRVPAVRVDFPLWRDRVGEIERIVAAGGFAGSLKTTPMIEEIRA